MKVALTLATTLALFYSAAAVALAEDAKASKSPGELQADAKIETPTPAQLRVQMHRTMAELIEARSAKTPNEAEIAKLAGELRTLRQKIWAQGPAQPVGPPAFGQRPMGGPGRGFARGRGYGRGGGYGRGRGYGRGYGRQWSFVDQDRDGVCDNYQRAWGNQ